LNFNLVQERKLNATDSWVDNQHVTFFSSYSYLGLNHHPLISQAKSQAVQRYGTGSHGVMMLGGYTAEHKALESELANLLCMEDAVLYSSGYAANMALIDSLMRGDGTIFCDMLVHTSIADGCRLSGAAVQMFPHQDAAALERMLARNKRPGPKLVIVDGVYSLRGEITTLPSMLEAAHAHGALLMVDEAHALGAIGSHGGGTAQHFGLEGKVDILTGGLGKAIPAYGGYVAARKEIVDYLRFRSNPYVYSGGMDPANVAAARVALQLMRTDASIMQRLRDNIALMQDLLEAYRVPSLRWNSPCMPVVCKDDVEAFALSREMRRRGFFIAPIVYPAVPKDQQGLRLTVTAAHTKEQITACVQTLDEALRQQRIGARKTQVSVAETLKSPFSTVPVAIDVFARGGFLLVADDEDRENEGDFVIAAEHATAAAVNLMITHGKGLVCLAISPEIAAQKKLKPMVSRNKESMGTAFTLSVDASREHGVTTGISAEERAKTIEVVISDKYGPADLVAPGHMFPLVAKPGGLRVRTGHTEAGVDLARMAGCKHAAAVIVEVIKDDGTMARRDDLALLARRLDIPFITTAQLVEYTKQLDAAAQAERRPVSSAESHPIAAAAPV
jgi:glycine C-acetyltransferase